MWPWEHLAAGYLAYSLLVHLTRRRAPRGRLTMAALVLGTQFPDLVDKPLAWLFDVLPSGTSLAHSVFVAVPFVACVVAVSWWFDRASAGAAFGTGYLLHLPTDVLYVAIYGSPVDWTVLLWPLYSPPSGPTPGFLANVSFYFGKFLTALTSPRGQMLVGLEVVLVGGALLLWAVDGFPGLLANRHRRRRTPTRH